MRRIRVLIPRAAWLWPRRRGRKLRMSLPAMWRGSARPASRTASATGSSTGHAGRYWTPLYYPLDAGNGPGVYYLPTFSSINGTPTPAAAERGWRYSPPGRRRIARVSLAKCWTLRASQGLISADSPSIDGLEVADAGECFRALLRPLRELFNSQRPRAWQAKPGCHPSARPGAERADDHAVGRLQAREDLDALLVADPGLDRPRPGHAVLQHEHDLDVRASASFAFSPSDRALLLGPGADGRRSRAGPCGVDGRRPARARPARRRRGGPRSRPSRSSPIAGRRSAGADEDQGLEADDLVGLLPLRGHAIDLAVDRLRAGRPGGRPAPAGRASTSGTSVSSTSARTCIRLRSPTVMRTVPGRFVVPAITTSPTSTSHPATTPSIGRGSRCGRGPAGWSVRMASLSRSSLRRRAGRPRTSRASTGRRPARWGWRRSGR